jgi:hypothetical protein
MSIVATSSVFDAGCGVATLALGAGVPQEEQNRTLPASSLPHEEQKDMKNFPLQSTAEKQASGFGPQTRDINAGPLMMSLRSPVLNSLARDG